MYQTANQKYRAKLKALYMDDIARLRHVHGSGRLFVEPSKDTEKRFTEIKEKREYRMITHPNRERDQTVYMVKKLVERVYQNIEEREARGID